MARRLPQYFVYLLLFSTFLQIRQIRCLRRLTRRKLSIENAADIRSLLSSALDSNPSQVLARNNNKRDISREDSDWLADENIASKDASIYDDEVDEDDSPRDLNESKRSLESDSSADVSSDQADSEVYDDSDLHEVAKDVAKREAKNEDDYDDDLNSDSISQSDEVEAPSANLKNTEDLPKSENRREASADEVDNDLNFEKQIEDQIQLRIDSIKEDIKREIERKQQVREIEANNAKYDELELNNEDNKVNNDEAIDDKTLDSSKRSISINSNADNEPEKSFQPLRSKRSDLDDDNSAKSSKRSISRDSGEFDNSGQTSGSRPVRSDVDRLAEVAENEEIKKSALILPVKKRSFERKVTLVEKREVKGGKRKDRSSILIPERGHAEVKDELPDDLTLDSNLRIARSNPGYSADTAALRSARSVNREDTETRYRRDMREDAEEGAIQEGNFLFAPREKPECRTRRRRSRGRKKARKHPRRSRQHRAIRESSMDDEELEETRDKRAMSLDEDAALEYKESFGGFQSDTSGGLGRFKRIRRSPKIS